METNSDADEVDGYLQGTESLFGRAYRTVYMKHILLEFQRRQGFHDCRRTAVRVVPGGFLLWSSVWIQKVKRPVSSHSFSRQLTSKQRIMKTVSYKKIKCVVSEGSYINCCVCMALRSLCNRKIIEGSNQSWAEQFFSITIIWSGSPIIGYNHRSLTCYSTIITKPHSKAPNQLSSMYYFWNTKLIKNPEKMCALFLSQNV